MSQSHVVVVEESFLFDLYGRGCAQFMGAKVGKTGVTLVFVVTFIFVFWCRFIAVFRWERIALGILDDGKCDLIGMQKERQVCETNQQQTMKTELDPHMLHVVPHKISNNLQCVGTERCLNTTF